MVRCVSPGLGLRGHWLSRSFSGLGLRGQSEMEPGAGMDAWRHQTLLKMCTDWRVGGTGGIGKQRMNTATQEAFGHFRAAGWSTVEHLRNDRVHSLACPPHTLPTATSIFGFVVPERESHIAGRSCISHVCLDVVLVFSFCAAKFLGPGVRYC